jgi:hypothetical protein
MYDKAPAVDELHQKLCSLAISDGERHGVVVTLKQLLGFEEQCCPECQGPAPDGLARYPFRGTLMCLACYANSWLQGQLS